jgi:hypothetical protein
MISIPYTVSLTVVPQNLVWVPQTLLESIVPISLEMIVQLYLSL